METVTLEGITIGLRARRDIVRVLPDLKEVLTACAHLACLSVRKDTLRSRDEACADAVLHAVRLGCRNVKTTTWLRDALHALDLVAAALVVREGNLERVRALALLDACDIAESLQLVRDLLDVL